MSNRKVLVFGTFDLFHRGHRNLLIQAKRLGDYLMVVVARDETVRKVKGEFPWNNEKKRKSIVSKSGLVDEVFLGGLGDKYEIIELLKPDLIALGYDQEVFVDDLKNRLDEMGLNKTEIIRLKSYYPEKYKSSKIKMLINKKKS